MGRFVLFVLLNASKVPLNSLIIVLQQLKVDSDIVIAGIVARDHLKCPLIPPDGLPIVLVLCSVDYTYFVYCSRVFRMIS